MAACHSSAEGKKPLCDIKNQPVAQVYPQMARAELNMLKPAFDKLGGKKNPEDKEPYGALYL